MKNSSALYSVVNSSLSAATMLVAWSTFFHPPVTSDFHRALGNSLPQAADVSYPLKHTFGIARSNSQPRSWTQNPTFLIPTDLLKFRLPAEPNFYPLSPERNATLATAFIDHRSYWASNPCDCWDHSIECRWNLPVHGFGIHTHHNRIPNWTQDSSRPCTCPRSQPDSTLTIPLSSTTMYIHVTPQLPQEFPPYSALFLHCHRSRHREREQERGGDPNSALPDPEYPRVSQPFNNFGPKTNISHTLNEHKNPAPLKSQFLKPCNGQLKIN